MNNSISSKPLIRQGWLRALIYIILFFILAALAAIIYFPEQLYTRDPISIKELMKGDRMLIFTFILFVLAIVLTLAFRRWIDRKSFVSLGLDLKGHGKEAIGGAALSVLIICASSLLLRATGHLKWTDIIFDSRALLLASGSIVLVAFYEELIFRGYLLNNLMSSFPKWPALLISAVLFMCFHWNPSGFFPMLNTMIMGLILGLNYIFTRNLWFSFCFHAGWKWMEIPVLGFSNDESIQPLLQIELNGDENITGGKSGLEGSAMLMAVSLLGLLLLYLFLQKKLNPGSQSVPGRI
jgi:membrane protease YdiL (CAAX protease family)